MSTEIIGGAAAVLLALAAGTAQAMAVRAGSAPAAPATAELGHRSARVTAPAPGSQPTLTSGVISAVDTAHGTITIAGHAIALHGKQLRVMSDNKGGRTSAAALRPGTRVRYALEPGQGEGRKIVLIYVEAGQ
ncbi:MAG: hypothetical protein KGN16_11985 [Burkholderiales bacterium]|nr:hypothetical protein [Burkholderiales bacterium]